MKTIIFSILLFFPVSLFSQTSDAPDLDTLMKKNLSLSHFIVTDPMTDEKKPVVYLKGELVSGPNLGALSILWTSTDSRPVFKIVRTGSPDIFGRLAKMFFVRFDKAKMEIMFGDYSDFDQIQFTSEASTLFQVKLLEEIKTILVQISIESNGTQATYSFNPSGFVKEINQAITEAAQ